MSARNGESSHHTFFQKEGLYMKIFVVSLFVMMTFSSGCCLTSAEAQDKAPLISHGEYSATGKKNGILKTVQIDQWSMYKLKDGSYRVSIAVTAPTKKMAEHNTLTKDLKPKTLELEMSGGAYVTHGLRTLKFACNFEPSVIACTSTINGVSSSASLPEKQPYVFIPTVEAPSLDYPWFLQSITSQAERTGTRETDIPVITIEDGKTPDSFNLKMHKIEHLTYLGREKIRVINQTVLAHKFSLRDSLEAAPDTLWLSDSGLLLQCHIGDVLFALTSYQGPAL
jgi:hypothetical protein